MGRSITYPLSVLTRASEALNPNQLEQLIAEHNEEENRLLKNQGELGILARSFDKMRNAIVEKIKEIETKNASLSRMDHLKDTFLANTSHELRTPLNGIIGIAESLIDGATGKLPEATLANLTMISQSGRRLASLVNDILDFSKMKNQDLQLQLKPVDVKSSVGVALSLSQSLVGSKPLKLINDVPEGIPLVDSDENRLDQILLNLIGNAIKFTSEGGVAISAKNRETIDGDMVLVKVSDTGIGIHEDKQSLIFETFEQADGSIAREYGGTGLGLAITKQLVELHGGRIDIENSEGQGTTFSFTLPVSKNQSSSDRLENRSVKVQSLALSPQFSHPEAIHDEEQESLSQPTTSQIETPSKKKTILVVDDEPVNVQVLKNQLSLNHYNVFTAQDDFEALELLEAHQPDLILLDVMMPRMSGYEVCQKLRERHDPQKLPVVMLTARNQVEDLVQGFQTGANDYLTKPFSKEELFARITNHLQLSDLAVALHKANYRLRLLLEHSKEVSSAWDKFTVLTETTNAILQVLSLTDPPEIRFFFIRKASRTVHLVFQCFNFRLIGIRKEASVSNQII